MKLDVKLRLLGNTLSVIGYMILIHIDPLWGSIIRIIALGLVTPFCVRAKLWDVVALFGFFGILDLSNVIRILIGG